MAKHFQPRFHHFHSCFWKTTCMTLQYWMYFFQIFCVATQPETYEEYRSSLLCVVARPTPRCRNLPESPCVSRYVTATHQRVCTVLQPHYCSIKCFSLFFIHCLHYKVGNIPDLMCLFFNLRKHGFFFLYPL